MYFSTSLVAVMALATSTNAASIQQRQNAIATADVWDLEECVGLPNFPVSVERAAAGECNSFDGQAASLKLRDLSDPSCQLSVFTGDDCAGTSTVLELNECTASGKSYRLTC